MRLSRREALRLIGLATASGSLCGGLGQPAAGHAQSTHQDTAAQINTHLFRLSEITLLESPFRQSQDRNQEYLLSRSRPFAGMVSARGGTNAEGSRIRRLGV